MSKARIATVWLDGCSGCHMSLLDMDERLIELADRIEIVHSPLVDPKEIPENIDVTLIEGAVSSEEDLEKAKKFRERSKLVVSLGDCAVTANVASMRNPFGTDGVLDRAYRENVTAEDSPIPTEVVPHLRTNATPVHEVIKVDVFLPGCPPPADAIHFAISELLEGRLPSITDQTRFGR